MRALTCLYGSRGGAGGTKPEPGNPLQETLSEALNSSATVILGRVTLLAGKNGVGKTTVLDAVRIWADRGRRFTLVDVLYNSDEVIQVEDEFHGETTAPDWNGLFLDGATSQTHLFQ